MKGHSDYEIENNIRNLFKWVSLLFFWRDRVVVIIKHNITAIILIDNDVYKYIVKPLLIIQIVFMFTSVIPCYKMIL